MLNNVGPMKYVAETQGMFHTYRPPSTTCPGHPSGISPLQARHIPMALGIATRESGRRNPNGCKNKQCRSVGAVAYGPQIDLLCRCSQSCAMNCRCSTDSDFMCAYDALCSASSCCKARWALTGPNRASSTALSGPSHLVRSP